MMRTPIASFALLLSVSALVTAQVIPDRGPGAAGPTMVPAPAGAYPGAAPAQAPAPASGEEVRTFRSGAVIPEPTTPEESAQPTFALPAEPIEPYLLQRHNGPFMVLARTFRGPDAAKYAQALAMELRGEHGLPAYVWYLRLQPGHSNIRNVPPTAPPYVRDGETVRGAERVRAYDEAAVLVGDCKTIDESEDLLKTIKKLHSDVVDGTPSLWKFAWRKGLARAMLTTNPLRGSQELFPAPDPKHAAHHHMAPGHAAPHGHAAMQQGQAVDPYVLTAGFQNRPKADPLVKRMNSGPRSLYNCPGPYALPVAEFVGRSSFTTDQNAESLFSDNMLKQSPLAAAADEAERLAEALTKCQSLPQGYKPFVYHDRFSSKVLIGPFQRPDDPNVAPLVQTLNQKVSMELITRKFTQLPLAVHPSGQLTAVPRE